MGYILSIFLLFNFSALATNEPSSIPPHEATLSDLAIPLFKSIDVVDSSKKNCSIVNGHKTCKPETKKLAKGTKVRIVSKKENGIYDIELFSEAGDSQGIYSTLGSYVDKALNWTAVHHALEILGSPQAIDVGTINSIICSYGISLAPKMKQSHKTPAKQEGKVYSESEVNALIQKYSKDAVGRSSERTLSKRDDKYLPGCEVLKEGKTVEKNKTLLKQCIESIRKVIASGNARNSNGSLNRNNLFKNMFKKLNLQEQAFAGKVFTSIGEVEILNNKADYMSIMKVLENRARFARNESGDNKYNELDAAISEWQFSMYNAAEPGWRKILDPNKPISTETIDGVLDAMVTLDRTDTSKYDNVYMYHANYVTPKDWDWSLLSKPFRMTFEGGIKTKYSGSSYHKFYTPSKGLEGVYIGNYEKRRRNAK